MSCKHQGYNVWRRNYNLLIQLPWASELTLQEERPGANAGPHVLGAGSSPGLSGPNPGAFPFLAVGRNNFSTAVPEHVRKEA